MGSSIPHPLSRSLFDLPIGQNKDPDKTMQWVVVNDRWPNNTPSLTLDWYTVWKQKYSWQLQRSWSSISCQIALSLTHCEPTYWTKTNREGQLRGSSLISSRMIMLLSHNRHNPLPNLTSTRSLNLTHDTHVHSHSHVSHAHDNTHFLTLTGYCQRTQAYLIQILFSSQSVPPNPGQLRALSWPGSV